ncbi:MAG: ABC transporter permease subunit [Spirochaetaceae bacterium]|nr:ABC transporter permease subunit [Spirochaetaceae bacterium]
MNSFYPEKGQRRHFRWFWMLVLLGVWELSRRAFGVNPLLMPPLMDIMIELVQGIFRGKLIERWLLSMALVCGGLASGAVLAMILVIISGTGRGASSFLSLISSLMHPLPGLALLPLVILWFGTGTWAVLFIIVHSVLWPIYINLDSGIRSLAPAWTIYARILKLSRWKTFIHISLPGSFPYLISGLRTGWARSWRAFIAAEMVFGAVGYLGGLGWQLFESRMMMDSASLYSGLLVIMLTGMVMEEFILAGWENRVRRRWGESEMFNR